MQYEAQTKLCRNCGLMGLRRDDGELVEAYRPYRESPSPYMRDLSIVPVCIMGNRDFKSDYERSVAEYRAASHDPIVQELARATGERVHEDDNRLLAINDVLNASQDECDDWTKYIEGLSPKERREVVDRAKFAETQHRWHADDLRMQKEIAEVAKETAGIQAASVRAQAKGLVVAALALSVTALLGIAGLVADLRNHDGGTTTNNYYSVEASPEPTPDTAPGQP